MSDAALAVHVVTHTHWDREWYHPASRFRQRLVRLVDELLDDPPRDGESFLLDGQAIVLEDYLAVRPERRATLAAALKGGSLEAGPWYVLADELIPGAEALVRNLLAGRAALARLGAAPPPVLYSPDAFGHAAALPRLARGFGIPLAIVWRGYGGARWPSGDAAHWQSEDGATVLLFHLPPDGYELGSSLPVDERAARARWTRLRAALEPRARLGVLLVQNGADHHARQRGHDDALRTLERAAAPIPVRRSSLRAFGATLVERAANRALPTVRGELRDSYGYTWTLQGTFASRAQQKRRNAHVERVLVREAEPLAALALLMRRPAIGDPRPLLDAAWRTLLRCHPHDTLCGCSIDEVARAMDVRLESAAAQASGLRDDALLAVLGHDPAAAREHRGRWRPTLVVHNAAPRPRRGIAEVRVTRFLRDAPVGPGSARAPGTGAPESRDAFPDGWAFQPLSRRTMQERLESPLHYPDNDLVEEISGVAWVDDVPPLGVATRALVARPATGATPPRPVVVRGRSLDNGLLAVSVDGRGRVRLRSADGAFDIGSLLALEDARDAGDLYTPSPVGASARTERCVGARVVHRGPLRGAIETRWRVRVPAVRRAPRGRALPASVRASSTLDVRVTLVLDAGAPFVRLLVAGANDAEDHRLRIVVRSGLRGAQVVADAAFGPVERASLRVPKADRAKERPPDTAPLHRWVALFAARRGATLYADGLAEYEATRDGDLAVTLLRAVGELSRPDLPERPGNAGWPAPTPGGQCPGRFEAAFAILPHGGRDAATMDLLERTADDVLLPLRGDTRRDAIALPASVVGPELSGAGLAFGAVKPAEAAGWTVLRCVNVTDREAAGEWRTPTPIAEARAARLDEHPLAPLAFDGGRIPIVVPPRGDFTVLVR
jgi:alpha-mannosidase